jgi:4-amino-4-deoxy-L-arabinose transferase-like glycosyltransferase
MTGKALPLRWEVTGVLFITLLAAVLRFYQLPVLPPGLHFDEGFKGVTARALLEGAPPKLFFESDMGEEPIAIYLVAAALGLLGQQAWIIRLPSAVVGTLTVPLAWWLGRERADLQAQVAGLGAAFVLAILYWHLSFSRIGMEPILVPFFAALAFATLARGLNLGTGARPAYRWFGLAGLALGGSLYTYKAGYFVPILALLFLAYAALVERGFLRRHGRGLLLAAGVALAVAAPIGIYLATHPASFLQRPASVSVLSAENAPASPWQALLDNLPPVLGMFFVRGDANPRSNLPGRPALDPFLAVLFLVGLGRALVGFRRPLLALPLLWLGVMVVPTLVTQNAPHFGRAIGATPALALLCGLGMAYGLGAAGNWLARFFNNRYPISDIVIIALLGAGMFFSGISTARAYFRTWGHSPDLFYAYDVGLATISDYVNGLPESEDVYLTPTSRDHYTLQFLVRRPLSSFDGRAGLVFPPPGRAATVIVLLREDGATLPFLQRTRPDGQVAWTWSDSYGLPYAAAYHLPASARPASLPDRPVEVTFGNAARLLGYSLDHTSVAPGDTLQLTLYWQAITPLGEGYTVFAHLLGEHNPATNGPLWAGHDGQPDGGHYPTSTWQPGQVILDVHPLSVPADTPPGEYRLEAGLYLLTTMTRLPAADAAGQQLADDAASLGTITVRAAGSD